VTRLNPSPLSSQALSVAGRIARATADGVVTADEARDIVDSVPPRWLSRDVDAIDAVRSATTHEVTDGARRVFDAFFAPSYAHKQSLLGESLMTSGAYVGDADQSLLRDLALFVGDKQHTRSLAQFGLSAPPPRVNEMVTAPFVASTKGPERELFIDSAHRQFFYAERTPGVHQVPAKFYGPFLIDDAAGSVDVSRLFIDPSIVLPRPLKVDRTSRQR
jgi:hypothetical protein